MKTKGIYLLYRFLQTAALPLLLVYLLLRGVRIKSGLRHFSERLGLLPHLYRQTAGGAVWLHAVSAGEVLCSLELLRRLREQHPATPVFVSTTTPAGRSIAEEKLKDLVEEVFYAPLDYVFAIRRVLRALRPSVVIVAETEIWPNLFREIKRAGCGLAVVNGRISDRAAPRYIALRWFFRHVLLWPDVILAQSEELRARFLDAGARPGRVIAAGNLKYDLEPGEVPASIRAFLDSLLPLEIWVAASTVAPAAAGDVDEDEAVIEAFRALAQGHPRLLLILAPRRPERFEIVAGKLRRAGVPFLRRSQLPSAESIHLPGVLLLDSIGELSALFAHANVVLMGGTLARRGGHNILEPAFCGCPIITGPHMENFRAIAEEFRRNSACLEITSASELAGAVHRLLSDRGLASQLGESARGCAGAHRGASRRAFEHIERLYQYAMPRFQKPLASRALLWPASRIWIRGGRWKQRAPRSCLNCGVISVGNIVMGGTGKTPIVIYLAERLPAAGILTRGYGRKMRTAHLLFEKGASANVRETGDEAQLFLRRRLAPVGIGADRALTGRLLRERFGVDPLILDDGFQHTRLGRQVDIVLIDALDPFGGDDVFPVGRLREPLEALKRATIFVITRSDRPASSLEQQLRRYNPDAPIFYARFVPEYWVQESSGLQLPPGEFAAARTAAFCGLANPTPFWRNLSRLGIRPVLRRQFRDHHWYRPRELADLWRFDAVLTTEKDCVKLPQAPPNLYWLNLRVEIEAEKIFWDEIRRQLGRGAG